ncbi:MAG: ABC transporter ATP-binding protein [Treponema sp.]|nr:ABC transporter ATP-binding protein [Treponema sp.]
MKNENAIEMNGIKKKYRLGMIGGTSLREVLQSTFARWRGKEDPNWQIGQKYEYGKEFWALNGVSFDVRKGEALGLIGHNGAGKSTLLKILSRITAPTEGNFSVRGRISSMLEIGTGFHGELTGRENIYMNAAILGMSRAEVNEKIDDIIDFSECGEFIDTPVKRYSSGMYVKLAFSVAAHLDSEILIMDEVLAVGDAAFQSKCLDKMSEVVHKEGRTVLYVSHNMSTIRRLCERCIVLNKGFLVYDGNVEDAIENYISQGMACSQSQYASGEKRTGEKARILDASFPGREVGGCAVFDGDESVTLRISVRAFDNVRNVHFRFLVRNMDTVVLGTFFTETVDFREGDSAVSFLLPLRNLPEGAFHIQAVLSKTVGNGANIKFSQVDYAVNFVVRRKINSCAGLIWNPGWKVNLGQLQPFEIKSCAGR